MSKAATSVLVFGVYLIVNGLGFLLAPNIPLSLFGFPTTAEPWIRVAGMLLLMLAYYFIQAARNEMTWFFRLTVHHRASVIVFFVAFVVLGLAQPIMILFGVVDLLAAIWIAALRACVVGAADGHPLLAFGSLTLASSYQADEAVQPPTRKRASGWRVIRRAVSPIQTTALESSSK